MTGNYSTKKPTIDLADVIKMIDSGLHVSSGLPAYHNYVSVGQNAGWFKVYVAYENDVHLFKSAPEAASFFLNTVDPMRTTWGEVTP